LRQTQGIAQNARTVEWLKAEVVVGPGSVCRALLKGDPEGVLESLAGLVISCYLLGLRVGLDCTRLDNAILTKLDRNIREGHEMETWYGDLSQLRERFQGRRK
jgi:hypothetical protein